MAMWKHNIILIYTSVVKVRYLQSFVKGLKMISSMVNRLITNLSWNLQPVAPFTDMG